MKDLIQRWRSVFEGNRGEACYREQPLALRRFPRWASMTDGTGGSKSVFDENGEEACYRKQLPVDLNQNSQRHNWYVNHESGEITELVHYRLDRKWGSPGGMIGSSSQEGTPHYFKKLKSKATVPNNAPSSSRRWCFLVSRMLYRLGKQSLDP